MDKMDCPEDLEKQGETFLEKRPPKKEYLGQEN
jgi:hypothetical protein